MAVERKSKPQWVEKFLEDISRPLMAEELRRRRTVIRRTLKHREKAVITPDKVSDYIRAIREDEDD